MTNTHLLIILAKQKAIEQDWQLIWRKIIQKQDARTSTTFLNYHSRFYHHETVWKSVKWAVFIPTHSVDITTDMKEKTDIFSFYVLSRNMDMHHSPLHFIFFLPRLHMLHDLQRKCQIICDLKNYWIKPWLTLLKWIPKSTQWKDHQTLIIVSVCTWLHTGLIFTTLSACLPVSFFSCFF